MSLIIQSYLKHVRGSERENFIAKILWSVLIPVSWISYLCLNILNFLFNHGLKRSQEPVLPVISVGNLTYGGTNKTPFVEMLARFMISKNIKPGIVSRGYSNKRNKNFVFYNGQASRDAAGDEPLLLSKRLKDVPVAVSKKRINGINALKDHGAEIVIADDAFQHRALMRDADILLIDASCPFGSGRMMPAGILREPVNAISRAHLIVITKCEQVNDARLAEIKDYIKNFYGVEYLQNIFTSRLKIHEWSILINGELKVFNENLNNLRVIAFSAIGNPDSFIYSLKNSGLDVACEKRFKDHHVYTKGDLRNLLSLAKKFNANALACTEKDLYNLNNLKLELPLIIPRVETVLDEPEKFFESLIKLLKPKIIVASNGYGEDAIGVLLAGKLKSRFKNSEILAFPLVGKGDAYLNSNFQVCSAPSVTPSGGVVKYRLKDLLGDMRAGLLKHVKAQLNDWEKLAGRVRTPICVGDVYLLLHTLWGSGARPFFAATAKTVYLNGHWRLERALIKRFALRTWTRDLESAEQLNLNNKYQNAVYSGSPIMDLLLADAEIIFNSPNAPAVQDEVLIMLLPGSRNRAYQDLKLLLDAAVILSANNDFKFKFRLVLAPTLELNKFKSACMSYNWEFNNNFIKFKDLRIDLTSEPVAKAAHSVRLLIGLGGTANQVCAGLGIPVISIDEKGKRVQKKLLGDSEILVENKAESLAECALKVLLDKELYKLMSEAGIKRMGSPGAIDAIINYAALNNGWDARDRLYGKLK